jgi:hypothetical protein
VLQRARDLRGRWHRGDELCTNLENNNKRAQGYATTTQLIQIAAS